MGVAGVEEVRADVGDAAAMEALVARSDAVIHLATLQRRPRGLVKTSFQGTFNLLDAIARGKTPKRFILASGDAVNGIYYNRQPVPIREDMPLVAYPGYYPLSKVVEEAMAQQYHYQQGVPTVTLRMSWIHAEDDILTHLTVADPQFGVPVWRELMSDSQRARFQGGGDAAVALRHPDGRPMLRHIVAVEDCVQAFLLALRVDGIEGQTFMIAMNDPFNYVEAAGLRRPATGRGDARSGRSGGPGFLHRHDQSPLRARLPAAIRYRVLDRPSRPVPPQRAGPPRAIADSKDRSHQTMSLEDRVILITGGTSGIGEAGTELFARQGAKVVTMSIQPQEGKALLKSFAAEGHACLFHHGDVTRESDVKAAVDLAVSKFGRLDAAWSNAGLLRNQKITESEGRGFPRPGERQPVGPGAGGQTRHPGHGTAGQGGHLLYDLRGGRYRFSATRRLRRLEGGAGGPDAVA